MAGVIRIHHPNLTKEEKESRMEQIKLATVKFYKEVQDDKKRKEKND